MTEGRICATLGQPRARRPDWTGSMRLCNTVSISTRSAASSAGDSHTRITVAELTIDDTSRQVTVGERPLHLTSSEYGILMLLARHPGKAFSRQAILAALWDESPVGDERAIDVHIHNMREKIEPDPKNPEYLLTVRGFGYRLREA